MATILTFSAAVLVIVTRRQVGPTLGLNSGDNDEGGQPKVGQPSQSRLPSHLRRADRHLDEGAVRVGAGNHQLVTRLR